MLDTGLLKVAGLLAAVAAIAADLGHPSSSPTSSTEKHAAPATRPRREHRVPTPPPRRLGARDGAVPSGTTVFDDAVPGVARLDPALLGAVRQAADDAAQAGVGIVLDSGWRSAAYQEQLLREATAKYGSRQAAARWVATPATSAHVSGDAVDLGPSGAAAWLAQHGPAYGLCRVYANEPWHFELRPRAPAAGCPPVYADPTQDPRLHPTDQGAPR